MVSLNHFEKKKKSAFSCKLIISLIIGPWDQNNNKNA